MWLIGKENDNLLQHSHLGNPIDRGEWQATIQSPKDSDVTERLSIPSHILIIL